MPKLSIVCPVYNVGQYLPDFLRSLANQKFQDFEVVFVYDKSNDNSLKILENFIESKQLKNTKLIVNEIKKGVGFARDLGFNHTNPESKYIIFLDSDDLLYVDFLEKLVNRIEETHADIVCCGYNRVDDNDFLLASEMVNNPEGVINLKTTKFSLFIINPASWNKIYKKEIVKKLSFGSSKRAEDLFHTINTIINSSTMSFVNEVLYEYRVHDNSLAGTNTYNSFVDVLDSFKTFNKYQDDKEIFKFISAFVFFRIGIGIVLRTCINEQQRKKEIVKESKKYLKENFLVFRKNNHLSFHRLAKLGRIGLIIWLSKVLYSINCFGIVVNRYISRSKKHKKEIRW